MTAWQMMVIARHRWAGNMIATAVGAIAVSWVIERGLNTSNPLNDTVTTLFRTPERLAIVLLGIAAIVLVASRATPGRRDRPHSRVVEARSVGQVKIKVTS